MSQSVLKKNIKKARLKMRSGGRIKKLAIAGTAFNV
jgi:hypothetical protein